MIIIIILILISIYIVYDLQSNNIINGGKKKAKKRKKKKSKKKKKKKKGKKVSSSGPSAPAALPPLDENKEKIEKIVKKINLIMMFRIVQSSDFYKKLQTFDKIYRTFDTLDIEDKKDLVAKGEEIIKDMKSKSVEFKIHINDYDTVFLSIFNKNISCVNNDCDAIVNATINKSIEKIDTKISLSNIQYIIHISVPYRTQYDEELLKNAYAAPIDIANKFNSGSLTDNDLICNENKKELLINAKKKKKINKIGLCGILTDELKKNVSLDIIYCSGINGIIKRVNGYSPIKYINIYCDNEEEFFAFITAGINSNTKVMCTGNLYTKI